MFYDDSAQPAATASRDPNMMQHVVDHVATPVVWLDSDARLLFANAAACAILGYDEDEMLAMRVMDIDPNWPEARWKEDWPKLCETSPQVFSSEVRHRDGHLIPIDIVTSYLEHDGKPMLFCVFNESVERASSEIDANHASRHDALTHMPNRAVLMERLADAIAANEHNPDPRFAMLLCDVDRFKIISDALGHVAGDELLVKFSGRLFRCLEEFRAERGPADRNDTVARQGGDEFMLLLDPVPDPDEVIELADRILRVVSNPYRLAGHDVLTTTSMGIVYSDTRYETAEQMLRDADNAMYRAKARGGNCHVTFDQDMHVQAMARLTLEHDLGAAVESDQLVVCYQPIIKAADGSLVSVESLIRWQHPAHGLIGPMDFIPIAEETGLIVPVGRWVLEQACLQMADWQKRLGDRAPSTIAVNLSRRQLIDVNLLEDVRIAISQAQLDPTCLELEVTETVVMDEIERVLPVMDRLRELGVHLVMDDFGTGHSSLSCLHEFPIDSLKIDRAFIANMGRKPEHGTITRAIIRLAHDLGVNVVAEGIETLEQLMQLQAMDCDFAQGYYFARPLMPRQFENWRIPSVFPQPQS